MNKLSCPWMFLGPSGSGKLSHARKWIEEANDVKLSYPLESRTFSVGDGYETKVLASPYHFEIDIPNLSMQDKQIIGDLLIMFLSSSDVLSSLRTSARKLVILRRAHSLSLPAAIRVRSVLQQYVLPANSSGMIWITAREVTGPLSLFDDIFVPVRIPRLSFSEWTHQVPSVFHTHAAWSKLEGRSERTKLMLKYISEEAIVANPVWPRRIQDFYDELIQKMIQGARKHSTADMHCVEWIRGRVYDCLSFCQTGPEIIDCCASAVTRQAHLLNHPTLFWKIMNELSISEPHTSYRTPLSLEWGILRMFEVMRKTYAQDNEGCGENTQTKSECSSEKESASPST